MSVAGLIGCWLGYIVAARVILRGMRGKPREIALAVCNLTGVFLCLFYPETQQRYVFRFVIYLGFVFFQFVMLVLFAERKNWTSWLAFFAPIAVLIFVRFVPMPFVSHLFPKFVWRARYPYLSLIGISYLAFRCSRLVIEIRNGAVKRPGLCEYLHFAFFPPVMTVGPISTYETYRRGFDLSHEVPLGRALLRIMVGLAKYFLISGMFAQLTYAGFLRNEHPHHWIDLPVAMVFYYLFLYFNFSGFCDFAIGVSALIGIEVPENFNDPFVARNLRDFWNRWHITLSTWMRDIVFAPLSKYFVRLFGPAGADHAIALAIGIVFVLIGVWHGVGWNFAIYGVVHAVGVVTTHYYTIFLKKRLGREGFKAYNENPWIRRAAVTVTFCYCAASLIFFANTLPQIREIFANLR